MNGESRDEIDADLAVNNLNSAADWLTSASIKSPMVIAENYTILADALRKIELAIMRVSRKVKEL